jgi:hypothetical protein
LVISSASGFISSVGSGVGSGVADGVSVSGITVGVGVGVGVGDGKTTVVSLGEITGSAQPHSISNRAATIINISNLYAFLFIRQLYFI